MYQRLKVAPLGTEQSSKWPLPALFLQDSYVLRVVLLGDSGGPQQVWGTWPFLLFLFLAVCDVIIITHTPAMI